MKKRLSVLPLCILFLFTLVIATTFAQEPRNVATSYIERALEQMGGVSRLEAIKTAHVEFWGHRFPLEESERPSLQLTHHADSEAMQNGRSMWHKHLKSEKSLERIALHSYRPPSLQPVDDRIRVSIHPDLFAP